MTGIDSSDALAAIVFGAIVIAVPVLPLGFKHPIGFGHDTEERTTFRSFFAKARSELRMLWPSVVIGEYVRGWESLGTTMLILFVSLYVYASLVGGSMLIAGGALWLLW